jgi:hypothetical protein
MKLNEPVNLATDLLLAGIVGYLAALLARLAARTRSLGLGLWAAGFAAAALAACSGGIYHGLFDSLDSIAALLLWKTTVLLAGVASGLLLCGCIQSVLRPRWRLWLQAGIGAKLAFYALWMSGHNDFGYVIVNYSIDLTAILLLQIYAGWARRAVSAGWVSAGIAVAFAGALIQRSGWRIGPHVNHNDLYHLVQVAAMWLLYRGVSSFQSDARPSQPGTVLGKPIRSVSPP